MTRRMVLFVTLLIFFCAFIELVARTARGEARPVQALAVHLSLERTDFLAGQSVPVTVEVSNCSDSPLLIGNFILRGSGGSPVSRIEFELKDERGRVVPSNHEMIGDSFSPRTEPNVATAFLRSYLLLYPAYALTTTFRINAGQYKTLEKPGTYSLSATYSSNGISYSPVYRQAGLSDDDVKSVPFKSWTGKISTNGVRFRIRTAGPTTK